MIIRISVLSLSCFDSSYNGDREVSGISRIGYIKRECPKSSISREKEGERERGGERERERGRGCCLQMLFEKLPLADFQFAKFLPAFLKNYHPYLKFSL